MKSIDLSACVEFLAKCNPILGKAREEVEHEWQPDLPPPTLTASRMARALLADHVADEELLRVADCVEELLAVGTNEAKDVVATGFLEAVVAAADVNSPTAIRLVRLLGPSAREYCRAWVAFSGG